MYTVKKTFIISAAHRLVLDYDSPCERLHGHNWKVTVTCKKRQLNKNGMVIDFKQIKHLIEDKLDHQYINDVLPGLNPTAENLARWITDTVPYCVKTDVQETEGNVASYERDS